MAVPSSTGNFEPHQPVTDKVLVAHPRLCLAAHHQTPTVYPLQILSWYPRILVYPNFIDDASAQHIISLAKRRMAPSGLAWRRNDQPDDNQQVRTSSGVFLAR